MAEFDDLADPKQDDDEQFSGVIKAAEDDKFEAWQEKPLPTNSGLAFAHERIIKKRRVETGPPTIIEPVIPTLHDANQMEVEPITEDEVVIGMRVRCRCGAKHEILFDYK